ncbi:MAG TPA: amidohydrolase family protein [Steroidobacter sp.]|uniref:amidohydrolase family protein n=1 Tax=Steroidobacter sp. TaxID=1978227 RepID=UPI002ED8ABAA
MSGYIDIVCNLYDPESVKKNQTGIDEAFKRQVRMDRRLWGGVPVSQYLRKMDRAGIERSLLIAVRAGDLRVRGSFEVPYERVAKVCAKYPDRFSGLAGVDPTRGIEQLKDLDRAINEMGFVGAHLYPHWFALAPDHAKYYPIYARCAELDVPIMMQIGHNLVYSSERRLPSVAKPITLDTVAIDFPTLKLIGIHIGVPWTQEAISMAWKHENVYLAGDAYAPKHWPKEFVHYANTYGSHKVLFGTDWPVIDPERAVAEVAALGLESSSHRRLMRDNALKLFTRLPGAVRRRQ